MIWPLASRTSSMRTRRRIIVIQRRAQRRGQFCRVGRDLTEIGHHRQRWIIAADMVGQLLLGAKVASAGVQVVQGEWLVVVHAAVTPSGCLIPGRRTARITPQRRHVLTPGLDHSIPESPAPAGSASTRLRGD